MICRRRTKQRHTAGYHLDEATVHYRFHPQTGTTIAVMGRVVFRDRTVLVVRQPDGTLAHLPEWMIRPEAARFNVRDGPRFPLRTLATLRVVVDSILLTLTEAATGGSGDATTTASGTTGSVRTGQSSAGNRAGTAGAADAAPGGTPGGGDGQREGIGGSAGGRP